MSTDRLRIAYLCDMSPLDKNLYSGGNARIYDALRKHAGDVTILSNSWHLAEPLRRLIHKLPDALNLRVRWRTHLLLAPLIARGVERELARGKYDVLFCAYAFQSLCRVKPPYPMVTVFTSDATQTTYRASEIGAYHKSYLAIGRLMDNWVERCERQTFRDTDLLLWPSKWQKDLADDRYGLAQDHSIHVPWGANLATPSPRITPTEIGRHIPLRLLMIGRDWYAKGGPGAVDTMKLLREMGIDARLTVIGCQPPEHHLNEYVKVYRQLDKAVPEELAQFERLLDNAHFLVQPSMESYGFAFCEASAYGIPQLGLRVGGVPVRDGINGHTLPMGSGPKEFADRILYYLDRPDEYTRLTRTTRREFEESLNWDTWGQRTAALLQEAVARRG